MRSVARHTLSLLLLLSVATGFSQLPAPKAEGPTATKSLSVRHLDGWIEKLMAKHRANLEKEGKVVGKEGLAEGEDEAPGVDFIRALRHYTYVRSYPNDSFDPSRYAQGVEAVKLIPPARRGLTAPGLSGSTWEFVGPKNLDVPYRIYYGVRPTSGRVNQIAVDPTNGQRMFLASAGGGVWRTLNGGVTWKAVGDQWEMQKSQSVAIDPNNPNIVYAGTGDFDGWEGYPFGLLKSTDGGDTWTNVGFSGFIGRVVNATLVMPGDSQTVFVAASTRSGDGYVWKTTDGGATWTQAISSQRGWYNLKLGAPDANGKRAIWAAAIGSNAAVACSKDNGVTWSFGAGLTGDGSEGVDVAPSLITAGTAYLITGATQQIKKTTDFGLNWTDVTGNHPGGYNWSQSWYDWHITTGTDGTKDFVYTGLIDVVQSKDGGQTWASVGLSYTGSAIIHNDQHAGAADPSNPNRMIFGGDGGIYELVYNPANGSNTITPLSKTLGVSQFYDADWHPTNPDIMLGGTQDNATPVSQGDLENWVNRAGGDGFGVWISPTNPLIQYATIYGNTVYKTTDGWNSQFDISPNLSDSTPFVTPVEGDPNDAKYVYTGNAWLHRFDGSSWTQKLGNQMLGSNANDFVTTMKVAQGDSNRIYVGTTNGRLWMSKDFGATWTNIRGNLPNRSMTSIDVDPNNKASILVGLSGFDSGHIWRCENTEAASPQWVDVSGVGSTALPNVPLSAITRHWEDPANRWFVGTDLGVFATDDAGANWSNLTIPFGLPAVQVTAIKAVPGTAFLNVASYGRGMWRISLAVGAQVSAIALNPTTVRGGVSSTATVTLSEPPATDTVVTLSSSSTKATVPPSVTVLAGQLSANFTVSTIAVDAQTTATIRATLGTLSKQASLTINPATVASVSVSPTSLFGGFPATGTVTLDAAAPATGTTVSLVSTDTTAATVPATVSIVGGGTTATFPVTTKVVTALKSPQIRAIHLGNVVNTNLSVKPIGVATVSLSPNVVASGGKSTGTVNLVNNAPTGGLVVTLSSNVPAYATVPASITIAAGTKTKTFTVTGKGTNIDRSIFITASRAGTNVRANMLLKGTRLSKLLIPPGDKVGGLNYEGTIAIIGTAPTEGTVVTLTSSNPTVLAVPASATVPSGKTSVAFKFRTYGTLVRTAVTVKATLKGVSSSQVVYVLPPKLSSVTLSPTSIKGGQTATATATIDGPAPKGGMLLALSTSNKSFAYTLASIRIPEGAKFVRFFVYTNETTARRTVQVTASNSGTSKSATLTIVP